MLQWMERIGRIDMDLFGVISLYHKSYSSSLALDRSLLASSQPHPSSSHFFRISIACSLLSNPYVLFLGSWSLGRCLLPTLSSTPLLQPTPPPHILTSVIHHPPSS